MSPDTRPVRTVAIAAAPPSRRRWYRHSATNRQVSYLPDDVVLLGIRFYFVA